MQHNVDDCPLIKLEGGIPTADDNLHVERDIDVSFFLTITVRPSVPHVVLRSGRWHHCSIVVFLEPHCSYKISRGIPQRGIIYTRVFMKSGFSTEIALYLVNGKRWAHGYYGSLLGSDRYDRLVSVPVALRDRERRNARGPFRWISIRTLVPFDLEQPNSAQ